MADFSFNQAVANLTDFVLTDDGKLAYITTSDGQLLRWDVEGKTFLSPLALGGALSSVDISPDGSYLLVGRSNVINETPDDGNWPAYVGHTIIDRVRTDTLTVTPLEMAITQSAQGVAHIALIGDNKALVNSFIGSGSVPLHYVDALADTIPNTTAPGKPSIYGVSYFVPSADNRYVLILEEISNAPMYLFDTQTSTFAYRDIYSLNLFGYSTGKADINTRSNLIVNVTYNHILLFDTKLDLVQNLSSHQKAGAIVGAQFTGDGEHLLLWDSVSDSLLVFDTRSWTQVGTVALESKVEFAPIGVTHGFMDVAANGRTLFLDSMTGFEIVDLQSKLSISLTGGGANDALYGSIGADVLSGGDGNDTLHGAEFDDILSGGAGDDVLSGGAGSDTASYAGATAGVTVSLATTTAQATGAGSDTLVSIENLTGSAFGDTLTGDAQANTLIGGDGDDIIDGGAGDDRLYGGQGNDRINGGDGDDLIDPGAGRWDPIGRAGQWNALDGGAGNDTASFESSQFKVEVGLIGSGQDTYGAGLTSLSNIENLIGSNFDDRLSGDFGDYALFGGAGDDWLQGSLGNDFLVGGAGLDVLSGDEGADTVSFADSLSGVSVTLLNTTAAVLTSHGDALSSIENLIGSDHADSFIGASAVNVFDGGLGDDFLAGMIDNDVLRGGAGNDILEGGSHDDYLDGGAGDDRMDGGYGADTATYESATSGVTVSLTVAGAQNTGGAGTDTLINFENLVGSAFGDVLTGDNQNNIFVGGAGDDRLDGGAGVDTAAYDGATSGVTVSLAVTGPQDTGGAGTDTLLNFETLVGSAFDDVLTGDERNNILFGAAGADVLVGGLGDDSLVGGAGDDRLDGGEGLDTVTYASAGAGVTVTFNGQGGGQAVSTEGVDTLLSIEVLIGSSFADTFMGDADANLFIASDGDDTLDGGAGVDRLYGGVGNDTYKVDTQADLTFELAGEGADTVIASASVYLYDNIETLTLAAGAGAGDLFGVGNSLANRINGNEGNNLLLGGLGNDSLFGGAGDDRLFGEEGLDVLNGDAGNDLLVGGLSNDTLNGGDGDDRLYGEDDHDTLTGGAGADILIGGVGYDILDGKTGGGGEQDLMDGGDGNDSYLVDAANDLTFEAAGGGIDNVTADFAGGAYYLYANVEDLTLAGTTANGVGNELDNVITGNASANWLLGGDGDDVLNGQAGGDVLFGQGGADTFIISHGTGGDVIGDFTVGLDKVSLIGVYRSFAEIQSHMVQNGTDSAIVIGNGDLVVFQNVAMSAFSSGDFIF